MDHPLQWLDHDEARRTGLFPVAGKRIFLGHAGVTSLPRSVADAVIRYTQAASEDQQEYAEAMREIRRTREVAARLISASSEEICLLGPTSLGLSMVARGIQWKPGDEIICYADDYPANVYPWMDLERLGVVIRFLKPETLGEITPELVKQSLTSKTRMVALASCNFLSGYRIDIDAIGKLAQEHGVLFCLDGIQTLGAFKTEVTHVDFMSADAHKWLLGPLSIGVVFVKKQRFEELHPVLVGAANVRTTNFIASDRVEFRSTAERYEPGVLNFAGVLGMKAAIDMILGYGVDAIGSRILALKRTLVEGLTECGFQFVGPTDGPNASGITTGWHSSIPAAKLFEHFSKNDVLVSHRFDRAGNGYIRFSPHFYNTFAEMERVIGLVRELA